MHSIMWNKATATEQLSNAYWNVKFSFQLLYQYTTKNHQTTNNVIISIQDGKELSWGTSGDITNDCIMTNNFVGGKNNFVGDKNNFVCGKNNLAGGKNNFVGGKNNFVHVKNNLAGGKTNFVGCKYNLVSGENNFRR